MPVSKRAFQALVALPRYLLATLSLTGLGLTELTLPLLTWLLAGLLALPGLLTGLLTLLLRRLLALLALLLALLLTLLARVELFLKVAKGFV